MKKRKLLAAFFLLLAACVLALCIAAIRRARLLPSETGISVPIFMYHAVGNDCWGEESLFVKPEELEKQLQYLSENGYETIFFEDLAHIEQYEKPVMLTFDDGYDDNSTNLLPLLQKYGMKATIFLIAGDVGKRHKLTREQISELVQSGLVSIQSHGWSHRNMANLPPLELLLEMARSQSAIAALTGRPPMKRFVKCFFELLTQIIVKVRKCKAQRVCVLHFQLAGSGGCFFLMKLYH